MPEIRCQQSSSNVNVHGGSGVVPPRMAEGVKATTLAATIPPTGIQERHATPDTIAVMATIPTLKGQP
jgi:hypothetical protein